MGSRYGSLALGAISGIALAILVLGFGLAPGNPPTDVIYIIDDWMTVTGIYSRTTMRHISAFMKEMSAKYGVNLTYQMAKLCWRDNYRMNLTTGEVEQI